MIEIDTKRAESHSPLDGQEARLVWAPLVLSIALLWIVPLWTSLGLDESGNWWVIKDGWNEMLHRAAIWSGGQSVLFNACVLAFCKIAGRSDIALRLPSVVMMLGTLLLLYRLGLRFGGPLVGMVACLAFVTQREVVYVASVLRPYSLGIFLATGAMLALMHWLDTGKTSYAILYAVCAGLTPYANFVHGAMFFVQAVWAIGRIRRQQTRVRMRHLLAIWGISVVVMIPLMQQAISLYGRRKQEGYLSVPSFEEMFSGMFPVFLIGVILFASMFFRVAKWISGSWGWNKPFFRDADELRPKLILPILWAVVPPLAILALGFFTDIRLFAGRYFVVNAPGVALLAGMTVRSIASTNLRRYLPLVIGAAAVVSLGVQEQFMRGLFDFRGAFAAIQEKVRDPNTPIVFVSGYVESGNLANVRDPEISQALMAPALRYKVPGKVIVVPGVLQPEAEKYFDHIFEAELKDHSRFIVCGLFGAEFYRVWLDGRASAFGFRAAQQEGYGGVSVILFEKITS